MTAEKLYIKKLVDSREALFPAADYPAIISSYTVDRKRMGGAPTLTATVYYPYPLDKLWTHEEYVEFDGEKYYASSTPSSSKDNTSFMYKHEISFASEREILDNTLFFDVVSENAETQQDDVYRSNQTKFNFGGNIFEFIARINDSLAYCGLYKPKEEKHGFYVVIDEGYGTDDVKEVSFENMYLTEVLQLINTEYDLDYYWVGQVCHVGKVQYDLSANSVFGDKYIIRYGKTDALLSVSRENSNAKIIDFITGYGSSDNIPYYYPNDDEFGKAIYEAENLKGNITEISLQKLYKWTPSYLYTEPCVLCQSKNAVADILSSLTPQNVDFITPKEVEKKETSAAEGLSGSILCKYKDTPFANKAALLTSYGVSSEVNFSFSFEVDGHKKSVLSLKDLKLEANLFQVNGFISGEGYGGLVTWESTTIINEITIKSKNSNDTKYIKTRESDNVTDFIFLDSDFYVVTYNISVKYTLKKKENNSTTIFVSDFYNCDKKFIFYAGIGSKVDYSYIQEYSVYFKCGEDKVSIEDSGIVLSDVNTEEKATEEAKWDNINGWHQEIISGEDSALKVKVSGREWIYPSSNLMPSIYRKSLGKERFYPATDETYKIPGTDSFYSFKNQYKKSSPHQGSVSFDDIKPTIKEVRNDVIQSDGLGQLFGEIADVAFDSNDSDVKDGDNFIHQYFYIKLHKFSGEFGFNLFEHALASENMVINMIDCQGCPACSFPIRSVWNADKSKNFNCVSTDRNGNLVSLKTEKDDYILSNSAAEDDKLNQNSQEREIWIALQKDTSTLGLIMPNAAGNFKPKKGDKFVITGIRLPKALITASEDKLDQELIKYMSENNDDQFNYSVKLSRIFLTENPDFAARLNENTKLSLEYAGELHDVFVNNYTAKVDDNILTEIEIELVNSLEVTQSEIKQIIDSVKEDTIKNITGLNTSQSNALGIDTANMMYLSKLQDDTARGIITFLKGIVLGTGHKIDEEGKATLDSVLAEALSRFAGGAEFGEYIQGILYGTGGRVDERGNAEFESITSRSSIIAKELIVNRQQAMEGNFMFTESGSVESVTEIPPATEGDNTTYELKLKKRWDGDFTAFHEQDCILASVNTLMENGQYYDSWFRVLSVNTVTNTISVVMYPDSEVPSGKNYPPTELARLIRWGNPVDEKRQSCWYISSENGLLVWLDHVTKPIIDKTNYSVAIGKLPDALSFVFKDFPQADKRDGAFYAKWLAVQNIINVDYEGNVQQNVIDRGLWSQATAESDKPYRATATEVHDVWKNGCRWRCLEDKTQKEPKYASTGWAFVEGNPEFTCRITGADQVFDADRISTRNDKGEYDVFTTLSVKGYLYNEDITEHILTQNIVWTRDTGNTNEDTIWAIEHAQSGFSVPLTWDDLGTNAEERLSCTFKVEVSIIDEAVTSTGVAKTIRKATDETTL